MYTSYSFLHFWLFTGVLMMADIFLQHDLECKSEDHDMHLCYLTSQGFHLSDANEFKTLTSDPEFQCKHCGRQAKSDKNLCDPKKL